MRKIIIALVAGLSVLGCATAVREEATPIGAGVYKLMAVENNALPEPYPGQAGTQVVAGDLILNTNGTFHMRVDMTAQVSALEPLAFTRSHSGNYTTTPIGATLTWSTGNTTNGAFFGKTLRLYRDGVEYLFIKE